MELSEQEIQELRDFKTTCEDIDIKWKQVIRKKLLSNNKLLYALNNKELWESDAEADEYFGVNILDYYIINPTQHNVQNFLIYETSFNEYTRFNERIILSQIVFTILCEQKNITDKLTYVSRHDLISAIIKNEFNWTNYFGTQMRLVSNKPSVVDSDYACRTLIFESEMPANIVKSSAGKVRVVTPEVHT